MSAHNDKNVILHGPHKAVEYCLFNSCTCKQCQVWKRQRKQNRHLPVKTAESRPWEQCHVDLAGHFTIQTPKQKYKLLLLTCIDPAMGRFEVVELPNKQA